MTLILDGRKLRDEGVKRLKEVIAKSAKTPVLAILQVGALAESGAYISQKKKFAEQIGAKVLHQTFSETVDDAELVGNIANLNDDDGVDGIIVQLPLPPRLDKQKVIDAIAPVKDVDGLTSANKKIFEAGDRRAVVPATAKGVLSLLRGYGLSVAGQRVTVIGRSDLVGGPIATLMKREGAQVAVCHRGTSDIAGKSRTADILIVAAGRPKLVTRDFVSPGEVVVDVGINSLSTGRPAAKLEEEIPTRRLVGDVDFEDVAPIVSAISPVPGGVGPMTVLSLFENLCDAAEVSF
ncbi:bifunctional 5,10-methylenetetrahydrofolate dehydrogenase/5,10-methenyltetrahydrofolate cyclohydrolase [Patescibacteria group bacterium]|nr:bifunctional 5,10-methylenetetrahydrofolate dehydrogenase/5,10-methenyltetrahydrofolate cyclohydrolase [Patescibacteria group bacterium]